MPLISKGAGGAEGGDGGAHLQVAEGGGAEAEHPDTDRAAALILGGGHLDQGLLQDVERTGAGADDEHGRGRDHELAGQR